ncbi:MAG: 50S ribosomal protein L30 [Candidatus Obscuribacterales bacterium]|nr:50S ribosomal protein L30 [Steroidobacteraceae bacterium]
MAKEKLSAAGSSQGKLVPAKSGQVKVTLVKSIAGQLKSHQATVRGLGLRRIRDTSVLTATPEVNGMLRAAQHLLKVEQA